MSDIDLSEYFYYDETSPSCLRWQAGDKPKPLQRKASGIAKGTVAGCRRKDGYWVVDKKYGRYVHRIVATMHGYVIHGCDVDHQDGNPSNNLISNLRVGPTSLNTQNVAMGTHNTSGVVGVSWCRSRINADGSSVTYATCAWKEGGKQKYKRFPTHKYGLLPAFTMAVRQREIELARLNTEGAAYTERHGKCLPA